MAIKVKVLSSNHINHLLVIHPWYLTCVKLADIQTLENSSKDPDSTTFLHILATNETLKVNSNVKVIPKG